MKKLVYILVGIAAILLLTVAAAFGWANHTLNKIGRVEDMPEELIPAEEEQFEPDDEGGVDTLTPEEVVWATPEPVESEAKVTNILLIGQDRRGTKGRGNSDSMIICSINEETRLITLVSLMRDMYVPFPGDYSDNRINAAYPYGGMPLLDQLIQEDFGVTIDGNIEVDFSGFVKVMNMIAPLEVELRSDEAWYLNLGTGWTLHEGLNALDGDQLLNYARTRYVGHADWERTERQRRVLTLAFEKLKTWTLPQLQELADAVLPCLTTDMSNRELLSLLSTVVSNRMTLGETHRLPVDGYYSSEVIREMSVLVPDLQENSRFLREYLYGEE